MDKIFMRIMCYLTSKCRIIENQYKNISEKGLCYFIMDKYSFTGKFLIYSWYISFKILNSLPKNELNIKKTYIMNDLS